MEDHFHLDDASQAELLLNQIASSGVRMDPKLREEIQKKARSSVSQTDLFIEYGANHRPSSLLIRGTRVSDGKPVDVVKCGIEDEKVLCKGTEGKAKMALPESGELFYSFPFPMLVRAWFPEPPAAAAAKAEERELIVLEYPQQAAVLSKAACHIQLLPDEVIPLGEQQFHAHKARISVRYEAKDARPTEFTVWYLGQGPILAMETETVSDERMALVQYKKYADF